MKKLVLALGLIVMAAGIHAQTNGSERAPMHRDHRGGHKNDGRLAEKLQFSDQQKQQLKEIKSNFHKQLAELKKNEDITVREYKSKMKSLHNDYRSQFQALLTEDQKAQLEKMKKDRAETARINSKARMDKMKVKLNLTDQQASQLAGMRADMSTKFKALQKDSTLNRESKREQMKALANQQKEQMKTILTPEQLNELQQMKRDHGRREFVR